MKRFILITILVVFALSLMTTISHAEAMTVKHAGKMMYTKSAVDLRMDMGSYGKITSLGRDVISSAPWLISKMPDRLPSGY
jgi:hypothetical protein